jgi:hypothetical protein
MKNMKKKQNQQQICRVDTKPEGFLDTAHHKN